MSERKFNLTRTSVSKDGIEIVVGIDRITVRVGVLIDDSELRNLETFARMIAAKCGKSKIIMKGTIQKTIEGGFATALKPLQAS